MLNSSGKLRVRAYTAGGALPVEGAIVRITGAEEDNRFSIFSTVTDRDGITESITLPAPDTDYSLIPNPAESPYSVYDVEISAPGYFTKTVRGLTVFPGISSLQLISMIPGSGKITEDYPKGSINYIIPDSSDQ